MRARTKGAGIATVVGALVVGALGVVAPPTAAGENAVVEPTTTVDTRDPGDGELTLREAVAQADVQPGPDTIRLAPNATYVLEGACNGDETTLQPALGVSSADGLTIDGRGATIRQSGPSGLFCDARVIANAAGPLTLQGLTITGGYAERFCDLQSNCPYRPEFGLGGGVWSAGPLTVEGVEVVDNVADSGGGGLASASTVDVADSTVARNEAGEGGGIRAVGAVSIVRTAVSENRADQWYEFYSNRVGAGGGVFSEAAITVDHSTVDGNGAGLRSCDGGAGGGLRAPTVTVLSSTLDGNVAGGSTNNGCWPEPPSGAGGAIHATTVALDGATIVGNRAGTGFSPGPGSAIVARNLATTRSVIGGPSGSALCDGLGIESTSGGFNLVTDHSCPFRTGPEDRFGVGDLALGDLADNGGSTRTRLPAADGALAIIPIDACGATDDQRGAARPQGAACEAGAVEIPGDVPPSPRYASNTAGDVPACGDAAVDWALAVHVLIDRRDGDFGWGRTVPRRQLVTALWRLAGSPDGHAELHFTDVPATAGYRPALEWAVEHFVIRNSRAFGPNRAVTRAALVRALQPTIGTDIPYYVPIPFTDVPDDAPYGPALHWVAAHRLWPRSGSTFGHAEPINRGLLVRTLFLAASTPLAWAGRTASPTVTF